MRDYGMSSVCNGDIEAAAAAVTDGMIDNPALECLVSEVRPLLEQALRSI